MNIQQNMLYDNDDDEILEFINHWQRPYIVRGIINHV